MVKIPPTPPASTPPQPKGSGQPGDPGGQTDRFAIDFGPDNGWSRLARFLSRTAWRRGLHPRTCSAFDLRCKNIAVACDNGHIGAPGKITSAEIEAWIATQTRNDTVSASYHVVFGRLLRVARLEGLRPTDIGVLHRLLRTPRPPRRNARREG